MVDTARKLECTIEKGLDKLISWQVGMGAEKRPDVITWDGAKGLGGVQNSHDESGLRIDVTQHQMHAIILTRRLVYTQIEAPWPWEDVMVASEGNIPEH
jgi:UDP-N-acetylmuramoyl-tripeptide--D-alanyl-D-alanine ligase